mmetsp:Transcript_2130/g.6501  ORF Transcript_2130/g.6501 Transcript_2130/m.6501 type:complete len:89 (+) Transcript_2130:651-917(+)
MKSPLKRSTKLFLMMVPCNNVSGIEDTRMQFICDSSVDAILCRLSILERRATTVLLHVHQVPPEPFLPMITGTGISSAQQGIQLLINC